MPANQKHRWANATAVGAASLALTLSANSSSLSIMTVPDLISNNINFVGNVVTLDRSTVAADDEVLKISQLSEVIPMICFTEMYCNGSLAIGPLNYIKTFPDCRLECQEYNDFIGIKYLPMRPNSCLAVVFCSHVSACTF